MSDNPSIRMYVNKKENTITFKIKTGYYHELFMNETRKLLGCNYSKLKKDKAGENVPYLEITEVILVHCNIVSNDYQQDSRVLYTFVLGKSFGQWLDISPQNVIFSATSNSESLFIEVWLTNQNSKPLDMEDQNKHYFSH